MIFFERVSAQELVDFAKNLTIMLKSGIPINVALASLAEQTRSKSFRGTLDRVKTSVEQGVSLTEAFSKEEKTFSSLFIAFLKAGEASGTLEESLSFLASWLEHNNDLRREMNTAIFYPKIILVITSLLGGVLAFVILPQLMPLFGQLGVDLPLATKLLLAFTEFVQKFWPLAFLSVVGFIAGFMFLNKAKPTKRFLHLIYLRIPVFGKLMTEYQLALICRLFTGLFKTGVPISESLALVSAAATNLRYQESLEKIGERVNEGTPFAVGLKDYPELYPRSLIGIVAVGEESGTVDNSFAYLAEFYSKEVQSKTKRLPLTLEPMLLVFIGLVVGFIALSIISPIYQLTSGFRL